MPKIYFDEHRAGRYDADSTDMFDPAVVDRELELFSAPYRYVWPSELDLMARLAGMTLRERWSNWNRGAFSSESTSPVSVWEKPASS